MRLLDRYLLRELLIPLGYCLGGFLIFWITYDLFTEISNFQRNNLLLRDVGEYYLVKAPEMLVIVIPLALLLSLLYALTNHARHQELTAMRAAGLALWRLALPYFGVAVAAGLVLFLLNELAVPEGAEKAERIMNRYAPVTTNSLGQPWQREIMFINEVEQRTWYIAAYNPQTSEMVKPYVECLLPGGARRLISAQRGLRTNGTWMFLAAEDLTIPPDNSIAPAPIKADALLLPELTETPRLLQSEIKISRMDRIKTARKAQLSIVEIREYLRLHPQPEAQRRDMLRTMLHNRMAMPWTCVVVVLIALPFGAVSGRRNVFVGVASSVFICFAFFVLRELSLALGGSGRVEPWLAAWAPNLVFGIAGIVMTQRTT